MLFLSPISEATAPPEIQSLYSEIKTSLGLTSVPYYFQIVANFPDLLELFWSRLLPIVTSADFDALINDQIRQVSLAFQTKFYPQISKLSPDSTQSATELYSLLQSNLKLFIISLTIRESLKGLDVKKMIILPNEHLHLSTLADYYEKESTLSSLAQINADAALAPISSLKTLLDQTKPIFEHIQKSEDYLNLRLELERNLHHALQNLTPKFVLSYNEVIKAIFNKPLAPEVIYLVYDVFPSTLPHQFFFSLAIFLISQPKVPVSQ